MIVSGWSDNGWLSGGHAVRMALELCMLALSVCLLNTDKIYVSLLAMHKAWPRLLRRIEHGKASDSKDDHDLVVATRTWFCLYLFEHQCVRFI